MIPLRTTARPPPGGATSSQGDDSDPADDSGQDDPLGYVSNPSAEPDPEGDESGEGPPMIRFLTGGGFASADDQGWGGLNNPHASGQRSAMAVAAVRAALQKAAMRNRARR